MLTQYPISFNFNTISLLYDEAKIIITSHAFKASVFTSSTFELIPDKYVFFSLHWNQIPDIF